jgi:hypothetical protein
MGQKVDVQVNLKYPLGLSGILFTIFLILKLTGTIGWSWWWVFAPIWIPIGAFLLILLIGFIIFLIK